MNVSKKPKERYILRLMKVFRKPDNVTEEEHLATMYSVPFLKSPSKLESTWKNKS